MELTPEDVAQLIEAAMILNFFTVVGGVLAVDLLLWALSSVRQRFVNSREPVQG